MTARKVTEELANQADGLRLARAAIVALQGEQDTLAEALRQALRHVDESVGHNDDCVPEARAVLSLYDEENDKP